MVKRRLAGKLLENEPVQDEPQRVRPQWLLKDSVSAQQPDDARYGEFTDRMTEGIAAHDYTTRASGLRKLRPVLPVSLIDELDKGYQSQRRKLVAALDAGPRLYKQIAMAALASMMTGTLAGLIVYERAHDGFLMTTAMHWVRDRVMPHASPQKKEIATTRLAVADMTTPTEQQMPLSIAVESAPNHRVSLRLTGLPETAYLTAGRRTDRQVWLVDASDLQHAKLAFHKEPKEAFFVSVAAIETTTGSLETPAQEMRIDVNRQQQTSGLPQSSSEITVDTTDGKADFQQYQSKQALADELMARANALLQAGNIHDARKLYAQANSLSASDALLGLAKTYDPDILAKLNVKNATPDTEVALAYYKQAEAAGAEGAKEAIEALQRSAK